MAAAVCLPTLDRGLSSLLDGVRDSKLLTPARRAQLYQRILQCAVDVGVGVVAPSTLDRLGLTRSGELAMRWAIEEMAHPPDCLLIDAFTLRDCDLHQRSIVHGDALCLSIAAASIVAKVARDRLMRAADARYPAYGFSLNKGYGTRLHRNALEEEGPCDYHRRSFEPIKSGGELLL